MLVLPYSFTIVYALLSRRRRWMWLWCAALMILMMTTASHYSDLNNYTMYYESVAGGYKVPGFEAIPNAWRFLCYFFSRLGLSYRGMQAVLITISMYLIHCTFKDSKLNENLFWGLYLIFPLPYQCVQTRFFLGTAIVWFGFSIFLKDRKKNVIKFVACLIVSFLIHKGCAMYMVLLLILLVDKQSIRKSIFFTLMGAITLYGLIGYVPRLASYVINESAYIRYFIKSSTRTSMVYFFEILLLWFAFISIAVVSENNRYTSEYSTLIIKRQRIESMKSIFGSPGYITGLVALGITLPLMVFDSNFCRCAVLSVVFSYYAIASYKGLRTTYWILLVGFIMLSLIGMVIFIPYEGVLKEMFSIEGYFSLFR